MKPLPHQIEGAKDIVAKLRKYMLCYIAWEERTMKSLTAILAVEQLHVNTCLIVTKKGKPLEGWLETLQYPHSKEYTVINYHKLKDIKFQPDIIIIDEAHNYISGMPRQSEMNKQLFRLSRKIPLIYISATPYSQGLAMLYHQFYLSSWSPWKSYSSYMSWFTSYGIPYTTYVYKRAVPKYDKVDDERVLASVSHLFIGTKTRVELGFEQEPEDVLHWIELHEDTKYVYNVIAKKRVYTFKSGTKLVADTITRVRYSLHMLEGGVLKTSKLLAPAIKGTRMLKAKPAKYSHKYEILGNTEKVDYIKKMWGDANDVVIMYHFKAEKLKLEQEFKHVTLLQATSNAEGIDLSMFKHLVIYSQDYSTARHSQRRARQANIARREVIKVHFLLVKSGVSEAVYKTVSINKLNYIDSLYKSHKL